MNTMADGNGGGGGLEIRLLRVGDEVAFRAAIAVVSQEARSWEFAFGFGPEVDFAEYVRRLEDWERGESLPAGFVPSGYYIALVDGEIVGRLSVRFALNEYLAEVGGHVGYGVLPPYRGRGYATALLREALRMCGARGIRRVLATCDADNVGSRKVIERCGGVFERTARDPKSGAEKLRFWLETGI